MDITIKHWCSVSERIKPLPCILCADIASVIVYAPFGCTCADNKIQPRCAQHLQRAYDSNEDITIIEDFRINP